MKKIIAIEQYGGGSYKFKKWAKTVTAVDTNKSNGYAFQGEFLDLDRKHELEVGTYILQYGEFGDYRRPQINVRLLKVSADGLELVKEWENVGRSWALECRDEIAQLINSGTTDDNPLAEYSTEELIAELRRRGVNI